MEELTLISRGIDDTSYIAASIAPHLRPGDAILLKGALAGGKTAFVQELTIALQSDAEVTSPTFTLAHFYPTKAGTVLHIDAYRLSSVAEYRDLGLDDYLDGSITLVEWGNIVEADFPEALSIAFEFVEGGDTFRRLTISARTNRWTPVLRRLALKFNNRP